MGERKVWARLGGNMLTAGQFLVPSSTWEAARVCARLAQDAGDQAGSERLEDWASRLEALVADHGELTALAGFINSSAHGYPQNDTNLGWGDPLAMIMMGERDRLENVASGGHGGDWGKARALAEADAQALPKAWLAQTWAVGYAKRSATVVKSDASSLPEARAAGWLAASGDLALAQPEAEAIGAVCKALWRERKKRGYGKVEMLALELCMKMPIHFGKGRGFVAGGQKVEMLLEQDRFAPQKAFVAYMPANPARGVSEGFWGSTNQGGMDLGAAKMFESQARAMQYFERQGFAAFALVEVSVKVEAVAHTHGKFAADGLADAVAGHEREEIVKALEMANIEQLRERLAALEAQAGVAPGAEAPPARKSRL